MLVYLDTNIWVYAYENDPQFGPAARQLMQDLRSGRHRLAGSLFVLNELLVLPTRNNDAFTIASYRKLFASPSLELLPYTLAAAQTYAQLRAFDRVKPLDALHLATAAEARVDLSSLTTPSSCLGPFRASAPSSTPVLRSRRAGAALFRLAQRRGTVSRCSGPRA